MYDREARERDQVPEEGPPVDFLATPLDRVQGERLGQVGCDVATGAPVAVAAPKPGQSAGRSVLLQKPCVLKEGAGDDQLAGVEPDVDGREHLGLEGLRRGAHVGQHQVGGHQEAHSARHGRRRNPEADGGGEHDQHGGEEGVQQAGGEVALQRHEEPRRGEGVLVAGRQGEREVAGVGQRLEADLVGELLLDAGSGVLQAALLVEGGPVGVPRAAHPELAPVLVERVHVEVHGALHPDVGLHPPLELVLVLLERLRLAREGGYDVGERVVEDVQARLPYALGEVVVEVALAAVLVGDAAVVPEEGGGQVEGDQRP